MLAVQQDGHFGAASLIAQATMPSVPGHVLCRVFEVAPVVWVKTACNRKGQKIVYVMLHSQIEKTALSELPGSMDTGTRSRRRAKSLRRERQGCMILTSLGNTVQSWHVVLCLACKEIGLRHSEMAGNGELWGAWGSWELGGVSDLCQAFPEELRELCRWAGCKCRPGTATCWSHSPTPLGSSSCRWSASSSSPWPSCLCHSQQIFPPSSELATFLCRQGFCR